MDDGALLVWGGGVLLMLGAAGWLRRQGVPGCAALWLGFLASWIPLGLLSLCWLSSQRPVE